MKLPEFELRRPADVPAALAEVADGGVPYCGGTELLAAMQLGLLRPDVLVDLKRVDGLGGITETDDAVVIGATTTHRAVSRSPEVRRHAAALAAAAEALGNVRVRATGTVAGNICFAEPRSDVLTALAALAAEVELRSVRGRRVLPITEFTEGAFTTVRAEDELLVSVRVPVRRQRSHHLRFQPSEHPTVSVSVVVADTGVRLAVGAVADVPYVREYAALSDVDADEIAAEIEAFDDAAGAEDYKRHLTAVFVRRAVARAVADA
jgi:aerobic carbon-monoxide dehydrogenase medium subunit